LASRAPYFHNGSAATLLDVVEFYNQRFNLSFTDQQKADLVAFLEAVIARQMVYIARHVAR